MDYTIGLTEDGKVVRTVVHVPITPELQVRFSEASIELCKEHGCWRILSDVRNVANVSGAVDQFLLANEDVPTVGLERQARIAILVSENDHSHDFIETVLRNSGADCKIFTDEETARAWLLR